MLRKLISAMAISTGLVAAPAHAGFILNWNLHPDGTNATTTTINEYLDLNGPSYIQTTVPNGGGNFTFNEWGVVYSPGHDGSPGYNSFSGLLTATFTTSGNATLGGSIAYTGGAINVYTATPSQYATANGIYGADVGTLIGTFNPVTGGGLIDTTGIPNGVQTISALATYLAPGYWFDAADTTDLATLVSSDLLFGFATTNASRVVNPTALQVSEIVNQYAGDPTFTNCLPGESGGACTGNGEFFISNNGQFRLSVPEPGSIALVGISLLGVGLARRRRS